MHYCTNSLTRELLYIFEYPIMHLDWGQYTGTSTQLLTAQIVSLRSLKWPDEGSL